MCPHKLLGVTGEALPKIADRSHETIGNRVIRISWSRQDARFEARDERGNFLGANPDQVKAIWSAVLVADRVRDNGFHCSVMVEQSDGSFKEEYVAGSIKTL